MSDKLRLLRTDRPLQERYDDFLLAVNDKNYVVSEFVARDLGLTVSEVDVFYELGILEEDEFEIIDNIGFDCGHLFLLVRTPETVRRIIYSRKEEIFNSQQPLSALKAMVDEHSNYKSIEDLVKEISGTCWMKISRYLKERSIVDGTINTGFRSMLSQVGFKANKHQEMSDKQLDWIVRGIAHDKARSLGVFTNDTIRIDYHEDYITLGKIIDLIDGYDQN